MLCVLFGWNWSSGSGEEDENVKSLRQRRPYDNDDNNDDGQRTNFDQKSSIEPSAQMNIFRDTWVFLTYEKKGNFK